MELVEGHVSAWALARTLPIGEEGVAGLGLDTACAIEALTDPASDAQGLQAFHRFRRLVGERVERVCGASELVDRNAGRLEREPSEPSDRGALVAVGIPVSQDQADPQRIVESDLWELACGGQHQMRVTGRERSSKPSIWTPGITHANICSQPSQARGGPLSPAR